MERGKFMPILLLIAVLCASGSAFGQSAGAGGGGRAGGVLAGQVTDRSSSVIASARIVLRHIASGSELMTMTDAAGRYQFSEVPKGIYRAVVDKEGFSTAIRTLTVRSDGEKIEANFELEVGNITEQVSVTATRNERDTLEIPVRTETITQEQIVRQNITTTQETMTNVPNVTIVGNGPFQMRPRLRGLDSTRILIMVDGERLNNSRVTTDRAGPEIGLVDPTNLHSVEVVSGSGSVLYGTDALSGTINILTDQPQFVRDKIRVGGGLNLFYSSNEDGRRGAAQFNISGRHFAVRFSGMLERYGNYHAGEPFNESTFYLHQEGIIRQQILSRIFPDPFNAPFARMSSEVPNSQSHGNAVNGVARFLFGDTNSLRLNWNRRRNNNVGFPDFSPPFFFQTLSLPFSNLDKYGLRYEKRNVNSWFAGFSANGYFQVQDRTLRNDFAVFSSAPPQPGQQPLDSIVRIKLLTDTRQNVKSYGADLQTNFLLSSRNVLTAGASFILDHSRDSRVSVSEPAIIGFATRPPAPPRLIPVNIPLGPPATTFPQRVPKSDFRNTGFFAQDEYDVNRWLRIIGGFRVDHFNISSEPTPGYNPLLPGIENANPPIDLSKLPSATGESFGRTTVTGDIGLIVRPTDHLSLSGRVGRSFRHPNLEELFFTGPATVGNIIANTQVKPETGINVDAGIKVRTPRYAASFTYFNNTYRNFISTEIISSAPQTGPILQAINFARLRIQGFETDGEATFALGRAVLTPFIAVGYLRGQILEGENPVSGGELNDVPADNISPLKAVVGMRLQSKTGRWWSEYNVRTHAQVGRVSPLLIQSPFLIAQDLLGLRGFSVQTLRGGYNFQREDGRITITLGLENFTNEFYREQFQFAPSRGRSFTVGLLLKYF
jgi:hemoglobin/transferrin/lactoferrin receptor protein